MVFQDFRLLKDRNVFENVAFAQRILGVPKRQIRYQVMRMLSLVGLKEKYKSYPGELSGGQQQRVALARALVNNPVILLADEPTGNLDTRTGEDTMKLLTECAVEFGQTLIVVTHNPEIAKKAQQIIRIEDGCIIRGL